MRPGLSSVPFYLVTVFSVALLGGCESAKPKKPPAAAPPVLRLGDVKGKLEPSIRKAADSLAARVAATMVRVKASPIADQEDRAELDRELRASSRIVEDARLWVEKHPQAAVKGKSSAAQKRYQRTALVVLQDLAAQDHDLERLRKRHQLQPPKRTDVLGNFFDVRVGAVTLSPYQITWDQSTNQFEIKNSTDRETRFQIEGHYARRTAWRLGLEPGPESERSREKWWAEKWWGPTNWDTEARIGYATKDENPDGATIVGSGEAFFETSLELVLPYLSSVSGPAKPQPTKVHHTVNLAFLGGLVTDSGSQDIHGTYGLGFTTSWGVPWKTVDFEKDGKKFRRHLPVEIVLGAYYGRLVSPKFVDGSSAFVQSNRGFPKYEQGWGTIYRADILVPLNDSVDVVLSGRYGDPEGSNDLNPWSLFVGLTLDPTKAFGALLPSSDTN